MPGWDDIAELFEHTLGWASVVLSAIFVASPHNPFIKSRYRDSQNDLGRLSNYQFREPGTRLCVPIRPLSLICVGGASGG